jgi:hypothetical protein
MTRIEKCRKTTQPAEQRHALELLASACHHHIEIAAHCMGVNRYLVAVIQITNMAFTQNMIYVELL